MVVRLLSFWICLRLLGLLLATSGQSSGWEVRSTLACNFENGEGFATAVIHLAKAVTSTELNVSAACHVQFDVIDANESSIMMANDTTSWVIETRLNVSFATATLDIPQRLGSEDVTNGAWTFEREVTCFAKITNNASAAFQREQRCSLPLAGVAVIRLLATTPHILWRLEGRSSITAVPSNNVDCRARQPIALDRSSAWLLTIEPRYQDTLSSDVLLGAMNGTVLTDGTSLGIPSLLGHEHVRLVYGLGESRGTCTLSTAIGASQPTLVLLEDATTAAVTLSNPFDNYLRSQRVRVSLICTAPAALVALLTAQDAMALSGMVNSSHDIHTPPLSAPVTWFNATSTFLFIVAATSPPTPSIILGLTDSENVAAFPRVAKLLPSGEGVRNVTAILASSNLSVGLFTLVLPQVSSQTVALSIARAHVASFSLVAAVDGSSPSATFDVVEVSSTSQAILQPRFGVRIPRSDASVCTFSQWVKVWPHNRVQSQATCNRVEDYECNVALIDVYPSSFGQRSDIVCVNYATLDLGVAPWVFVMISALLGALLLLVCLADAAERFLSIDSQRRPRTKIRNDRRSVGGAPYHGYGELWIRWTATVSSLWELVVMAAHVWFLVFLSTTPAVENAAYVYGLTDASASGGTSIDVDLLVTVIALLFVALVMWVIRVHWAIVNLPSKADVRKVAVVDNNPSSVNGNKEAPHSATAHLSLSAQFWPLVNTLIFVFDPQDVDIIFTRGARQFWFGVQRWAQDVPLLIIACVHLHRHGLMLTSAGFVFPFFVSIASITFGYVGFLSVAVLYSLQFVETIMSLVNCICCWRTPCPAAVSGFSIANSIRQWAGLSWQAEHTMQLQQLPPGSLRSLIKVVPTRGANQRVLSVDALAASASAAPVHHTSSSSSTEWCGCDVPIDHDAAIHVSAASPHRVRDDTVSAEGSLVTVKREEGASGSTTRGERHLSEDGDHDDVVSSRCHDHQGDSVAHSSRLPFGDDFL